MNKPGLVYYHLVVEQDLPRLDPPVARRIKAAIDSKLAMSPEIYGTPLRGEFRNYRKLRVGDWRVVYLVAGPGIIIWLVAHRREVYDLLKRRVVA